MGQVLTGGIQFFASTSGTSRWLLRVRAVFPGPLPSQPQTMRAANLATTRTSTTATTPRSRAERSGAPVGPQARTGFVSQASSASPHRKPSNRPGKPIMRALFLAGWHSRPGGRSGTTGRGSLRHLSASAARPRAFLRDRALPRWRPNLFAERACPSHFIAADPQIDPAASAAPAAEVKLTMCDPEGLQGSSPLSGPFGRQAACHLSDISAAP